MRSLFHNYDWAGTNEAFLSTKVVNFINTCGFSAVLFTCHKCLVKLCLHICWQGISCLRED